MHAATLAAHIFFGGSGIILGFVALSSAKGAPLHRRSGMLFVYAMIAMALIGATMSVVWDKAPTANGPIGLLTTYLVITSLTTVRPSSAASRRLDMLLMLVALSIGAALLAFGMEAISNPDHRLQGMPAPPYFVFAAIALLASAGDLRLILSGGVQVIRGAPRLVRHLWRMCFALLIAAFSFFLGQAKVIPKPIRIFPLLLLPPLIVLAVMLYWLWRLRVRRSLRGITVVGAPEPA